MQLVLESSRVIYIISQVGGYIIHLPLVGVMLLFPIPLEDCSCNAIPYEQETPLSPLGVCFFH
jgi:hypothetical protein